MRRQGNSNKDKRKVTGEEIQRTLEEEYTTLADASNYLGYSSSTYLSRMIKEDRIAGRSRLGVVCLYLTSG